MIPTSTLGSCTEAARHQEDLFPLAAAQKQLWVLEQLTPGGAEYNVPNAYRFRGDLNVGALKRSFSKMIQRHQALRTYFKNIDGQPFQAIAETAACRFSTFDLRHLSGAISKEEAHKLAETTLNLPFDLTSLPLWRASLIHLEEQEHWLIFSVHHIVFDGWSADLFFKELLMLYDADCRGRRPALPEQPMQFTDFVHWQQQHLQGEVLDGLLKYWTQKLGSIPQPLELPTDFSRPPQPSYQGACLSIDLPESLTNRLRILSQQRQTTLFMTLLAAFNVLLFRYTARQDIAIGTPAANRSNPDMAGIVGFLVNTLVIRTHLTEQQSFADLLEQVRVSALEAYDHADLPFDSLVKALQPERNLSYNPLFQVMFQLHNRSSSPQPSAIACEPLDTEARTANFDLTLEVHETSTALVAEIEYSSDLFRPETVQRMLGHFKVLLEGIVAYPQQPIAELPLLTPKERHQLLEIWSRRASAPSTVNQTGSAQPNADLSLSLTLTGSQVTGELIHAGSLSKAEAIATVLEQFLPELRRAAAEPDYCPPEQLTLSDPAFQVRTTWSHLADRSQAESSIKCLHQYVEDKARQTPDQVALRDQQQQLTYAELNARANQVARLLVAQRIAPDTPVGLCFERSLDQVVALLAVLKAGGAYLPLDPAYPQERLDYILRDAQVSVALTQKHLKFRISGVSTCFCIDGRTAASEDEANLDAAVKPNHLAYIIYTSGSTGKPKGVMVEHRAASHFVKAAIACYGITADDSVLQFASISFDVAVEEIFTALAAGATLQLRNDDMLSSASRFLRDCRAWELTVLNLPTAYWHQLVGEIAAAQIYLPPAIRLVIIGGERALPSLVKDWQRRVGDYPQLINAYGPTEATVTATGLQVTSSTEFSREVPIGRPLSNAEVYILGDRHQPVPIGIPGELYIGGSSLARGYLNRPDLTQLKFIPHPFSAQAGARLYRTGDRARYLPDGNIEFLGRVDSQVKIRGFRIELGEVEAALLEYPGVRETVVTVCETSPGNPQLAAYVVAHPDQPLSIRTLQGFLRQSLPNYMVPTAIVALEALPLTPNGKIELRALPAPSPVAIEDKTRIAPRTPLESTLSKIWAETLELPQVSIRDSFFELGGHSLQAAQIVARILNDLEVELPLSRLFQAPTVEDMARVLAHSGAKAPWSPLVPLQSAGSQRPFFAIHGGHGEVMFYQALADRLGKNQPFYALRAQGNDYPDMAHTQIEEMASCYVKAIRKVQPEGPYQIGGASLGGIVAFEIAQQLRSQGQATAPLIIFDTGGFDDYSQPLPIHRRIINGFRYMPRYGLAETWKRVQLRVLKLFALDSAVEFYRATGKLPDRSSPELRVWEDVWETNLNALETYVPRSYAGRIMLLCAVDDGDYMWNQVASDYGWGSYAQGGVERYDIPGTHVGMFQEPHVQQLAQALKQLLASAE
ncbi:MAG: amino acid adenylation domain-containing protein [Elainellaceae cyanobacterium]